MTNDHARFEGSDIPITEQELSDYPGMDFDDDDDNEDICDECDLPADECECDLGDED